MIRQTKGVIVANKQLSTDIYRMTIEAPEIARAARPGQFLMVQVNGLDPLLRRPFSIHQRGDTDLAILYKRIGKGTELLTKMPTGAALDILGPLGNQFKWQEQRGEICLIGGGMGVAPLLFLAGEMLKGGTKPHIMLGARNKAELTAFLPAFAALDCPISYATDDGSMGHKGFIIECAQDAMKKDDPWQVFACGPYPMLRGIAALCRRNHWPCQVSMETMMACGIFACLGCTIEAHQANQKGGNYLHVCQDGPVFAAERIRWKQ
jgi:dihydroorotate dehydrogenase electron transfer subunit